MPMEWIYNSIIGFLAAIMASMGLGGGAILLLYLSLFTDMAQSSAAGINLIFFIPVAAVALIFHSKNKLVKWKTALISVLFGIVGVFAGFFLSKFLGNEMLRKLFYLFLLVIGIKDLFFKGKSDKQNAIKDCDDNGPD